MIATGPVSFALAMSLAVGVVVSPPPEPRVTNNVTPTVIAMTRSTETAISSHFRLLPCFGGGGGC
jgi:hypothetical protein